VLIDCDTCRMRDVACQDCVVSVLLGSPPELELDGAERAAIAVLAGSGLVPPLRLVATGSTDRDENVKRRATG
jgi:hypothetical protein